MNDETIVIDVKEYMYGTNGVVFITGTDGTKYKTHSMNVIIKDGEINE